MNVTSNDWCVHTALNLLCSKDLTVWLCHWREHTHPASRVRSSTSETPQAMATACQLSFTSWSDTDLENGALLFNSWGSHGCFGFTFPWEAGDRAVAGVVCHFCFSLCILSIGLCSSGFPADVLFRNSQYSSSFWNKFILCCSDCSHSWTSRRSF